MGGFLYSLLDLAPDFVGVLQGLTSTAFAIQGLLLPMIVSAMTPNVNAINLNEILDSNLIFMLKYRARGKNGVMFLSCLAVCTPRLASFTYRAETRPCSHGEN